MRLNNITIAMINDMLAIAGKCIGPEDLREEDLLSEVSFNFYNYSRS
jgi:hypothetical protein